MTHRPPTPVGAFPGHAVVQVPIPVLEPWVRARTSFYDTAYVSADPDFVHAHVTALGPLPSVLEGVLSPADAERISRASASVRAFSTSFAEIATFPNGVVHLVPTPAAGFSDLTRALRAEFPTVLPYGGEFEPAPHLTLDAVHDDVTESSTLAAMQHLLPAQHHATSLDLAWYEPGHCRLLARWELGTGVRVR